MIISQIVDNITGKIKIKIFKVWKLHYIQRYHFFSYNLFKCQIICYMNISLDILLYYLKFSNYLVIYYVHYVSCDNHHSPPVCCVYLSSLVLQPLLILNNCIFPLLNQSKTAMLSDLVDTGSHRSRSWLLCVLYICTLLNEESWKKHFELGLSFMFTYNIRVHNTRKQYIERMLA